MEMALGRPITPQSLNAPVRFNKLKLPADLTIYV